METTYLEALHLSCLRQQKTLFADISFALTNGQALLVEGENGAGKSSLLRLLTGLSTPHAGEIHWQKKAIDHDLSFYWQHLHYISHQNGLKLGLTVLENIYLMQHLAFAKPPNELNEILERLQLKDDEKKPARLLSAGQKRRLALAKLFLLPKICWIVDEPLTSLDKEMQILFLSHLKNHLQEGGIAVISSHHPISLPDFDLQILRLPAC